MQDCLTGVLAYLIGAFPSAYIFGRLFKGIDIRRVGSGNVGGMNTAKEAGLLPGILTVVADIGKGALAVYLAGILSGNPSMLLLAAFLAVLGHNYNIFLGFQGGKGLATTIGALLVLSPVSIIFLVLLALAFALALRDANTGAGVGAALIPAVFWFQHRDWLFVLAGAAMAIIIVAKHIRDFRAYGQGRRKLI